MNQEHIQRLLAGYATGQLSDEEKKQLFAAALENQELFDQLVEEDALREVIELPGARGRLLAALEPESNSFAAAPAALIAGRKLWLAWAAAVAVISFSGVLTFYLLRTPSETAQIAEVRDTASKQQAPAYQPPPQSEPVAKPIIAERPPELKDKAVLPAVNMPIPSVGPPQPIVANPITTERDATTASSDFRRREAAETRTAAADALNEVKKERLDVQPQQFAAAPPPPPPPARAVLGGRAAPATKPPAPAAEPEAKAKADLAETVLASAAQPAPPRIWRRRADGVWVRLLPAEAVSRNETLSLRWTPAQSGPYSLSAIGIPPSQILNAVAGRELEIPISPAWLSAAQSNSLTLTLSPGSSVEVAGAVSSLRQSAGKAGADELARKNVASESAAQSFQIILRLQ